jgi:hypothetical protein
VVETYAQGLEQLRRFGDKRTLHNHHLVKSVPFLKSMINRSNLLDVEVLSSSRRYVDDTWLAIAELAILGPV